MSVVLGIDAAWTEKEPSGVALAVETDEGWVLKAAEPSYDHFFARAAGRTIETAPTGRNVTASALVEAVKNLVGRAPDLVAIDMPLSLAPITGRRGADEAISKTYGAKWCATHSPSAERPGPISDRIRKEFSDLGYQLCIDAISQPGLMEVYPHPALVELADEPKRLPYKVGRVRGYWPTLTPKQRLIKLIGEWEAISDVLDPYLRGSADVVRAPLNYKLKDLKAREDMLDAIICCISAIRALQGAATSHYDAQSAIWVPIADAAVQARTLLPKSPYSARAEMRAELFSDQLLEGKYRNLFDPDKIVPGR